ncbi:hypothetical protein J2X16_000774 [Pelomonas aquatica]|uniref:SWIM-type domain-containing protein n=1 Tax=Pelomonas aquatica TaxID=431058 RepID=A0ABU1Z4C3_9BURK|nr:hypothetical protein [Pelomonas aquatica]MDR7295453.1 hypothetical protein [Pelomonas aquatica]
MSIPRVGNATAALNRLQADELASRRQAATILRPEEVASRLSPARLLTTTLGGRVRPITSADLAAFRKAVAALGERAHVGITAAEALSLSTPADVERAKREIRYAMPARLQAGKVQFVTNSGPNSKVTRHFVTVEFVGFASAVAQPGTPLQAAMSLVKQGRLRFECSCEHFRFVLRYVATAGGWVAGRPEHGLPKLTNPTLDGASCKHLVRVMNDIQLGAALRQRVAQMIEAERAHIDRPGKARPKAVIVRQADAERMQPKNARRIVVPASARGATLPPPASAADIRQALAAFAGKGDVTSDAIARALSALLPTGTR